MLRLVLMLTMASVLALGSAGQATAAPSVPRPAVSAAQPRPVLVAFRLGGYRRGGYGYGYGRSRYGYGGYGYGRPRSGLLHRVVKTAIWLYIAHLFFSQGGLSILLWILIIGLVLSLVRRRRRRFAYGPGSSWR